MVDGPDGPRIGANINRQHTWQPRRARHLLAPLLAAGLTVAFVAGCGSDDEKSAQDRYCEAGASLEVSVDALADIDLLAEGTDGLESAVEAIERDVTELRDTATDAADDDVKALQQSIDGLGDALSGLGGAITTENVAAVGAAVGSVSDSVQAVYATLTDCP